VGPARMIAESLTLKPGIREHNLPTTDLRPLTEIFLIYPARVGLDGHAGVRVEMIAEAKYRAVLSENRQLHMAG
jgi:hypothetical protein